MISPLLRSPWSLLASLLLIASSVPAQDWPNWRGPNHDGSAEALDLPIDFDQEKRVLWTADMPGPAACTPIVIGDRIFLSSVDSERQRLVALCLNRFDGKVIWQRDAGSGYQPDGRGTRTAVGSRTTYGSPSPTSDGERVVFFFGNGDLITYDLEGEELWRRNIQEDYGNFAFNWTFSSSPTLWEGKLFLAVMQRDRPIQRRSRAGRPGGGRRGGQRNRQPRSRPSPEEIERRRLQREQAPPAVEDPIESFLLAIDPASGETIYKRVRPSPARMESLEAYTTITPVIEKSGRKVLLLIGGDVLTGHDPADGEELWRWGTWNEGHRQRAWRIVPTPVVGGEVALVAAPKRAPVYAIHLGGDGVLDESALAWKSQGRPNPVSSDVPTAAVADGYFYVLSDVQRALSKVDVSDGTVLWTTEMPRDYLWRASPTVADGKVWCMNHNGEVVVVDTEDGEILHRVNMGTEDDDRIRSSIVVAYNRLFIRTNATLFCIGQ